MVNSEELYEFARRYLVGGMCSCARTNRVLGHPLYITRGERSKVYDVNGREYIDFDTSHGASLFGHNDKQIKKAVEKVLDMGIICSHETEYQSKLAEKMVNIVPCAELVRLTNSGTEATMHAVRLAREYTGKDKIVKFEGHFHGMCDCFMFGLPPSVQESSNITNKDIYPTGVPKKLEELTIIVPFNNLVFLKRTIEKNRDEIAAVIAEPINYNSGGILPKKGYLAAIKEICRANNIILIFDEVLSCFKTGPDCAQGYLGVTPDICALGKSLGGGLPISAFAGRREIMEHEAPLGKVIHGGTYNGHLIPVMAAIASLDKICQENFYTHINKIANHLYSGIEDIFARKGVKGKVQGVGARFGIFFGIGADEEITDSRMLVKVDRKKWFKFLSAVTKRGVYFVDSWHHGFSSAHTLEDIDEALNRIETAVEKIK